MRPRNGDYELLPATRHALRHIELSLQGQRGLAASLLEHARSLELKILVPRSMPARNSRLYSAPCGGTKLGALEALADFIEHFPMVPLHLSVQDLWSRPDFDEAKLPAGVSHLEVGGVHYFGTEVGSSSDANLLSCFISAASPRVVGAIHRGGPNVLPIHANIHAYVFTAFAGEGFLILASRL